MNDQYEGSSFGTNSASQRKVTQKQNVAYKHYEVAELKEKLDAWKVLLLPITNLLEWEHKFDPFIIVGLNTFLFGLLMYYSPSILTTISVIGLTMLLVESAVPLITGYFFKQTEWDSLSEMKYTRICERISNFHRHFISLKIKLDNIRKERQSLYFLLIFFLLIFCAYVGQMVDNLLLTYFTVLILSLTPGARRHHMMEYIVRRSRTALGIAAAANKMPNPSTTAASSSSQQQQSKQPDFYAKSRQPFQTSTFYSTPAPSAYSAASSAYSSLDYTKKFNKFN